MPALDIAQTTKVFHTSKGPLTALNDVSFVVDEGRIHGLLGPNGAGKSTLIGLITGTLTPTTGSVRVFDVDVVKKPNEAKQLLGVVPQELVTEMAFTVNEILYYFGGMYGVPVAQRQSRIDYLLERLDLTDKKNDRARNLSGGMKRRLMVAKALMHEPRLVILDEPTAGVDVSLRQRIWELVKDINGQGTTILFTTHYLEEAEKLCEKITVINKGTIISDGSLSDLQKTNREHVIRFEVYEEGPVIDGAAKHDHEWTLPVTDLASDVARIHTFYGDRLKSLVIAPPSLEQIFLKLTS